MDSKMRQMPLKEHGISDSRMVLGCMSFGGGWRLGSISKEDIKQAEAAIDAALSIGIRMFDHADIYAHGKAEEVFGQILHQTPSLRSQMVIQSKCGIQFANEQWPGRYNFSREHILQAAEGSLRRLGIEQLDVLLLHRPDPLVEPDEVAEAFDRLRIQGKVRHFGVSNMNVAQIRFLQRVLSEPLRVNQMEMSLGKLDWLDQGVSVNQTIGNQVQFADGLLEYCQIEHIQLQAWSPLFKGVFSGADCSGYPATIQQTAGFVSRMAKEKETTPEAIILGWLMRHPAMIQPVMGSIQPNRIIACRDAISVAQQMSREEWYQLYVMARGRKLP